jgi:hypothetical protein
MNSGDREGLEVPAPLVTPVVLLVNDNIYLDVGSPWKTCISSPFHLYHRESFILHVSRNSSGLLVEQALLTLPDHLNSSAVFSGVCVAQSLVFCVLFCVSLFVFSEVCVAQSLVFCVVFCRTLFIFSGVCVAHSLVFCVVFKTLHRKLKIELHKPH